MPNALAEPPCSESRPPEPQPTTEFTKALAELSERVAVLETRLAPRIKPKANPAKRMGRRDRVPFGWQVDRRNDQKLVPEWYEQETIRLAEAVAEKGMGLREIGRYLEARGRRRRGLKSWTGAHSLLRAILKRGSLPPGR